MTSDPEELLSLLRECFRKGTATPASGFDHGLLDKIDEVLGIKIDLKAPPPDRLRLGDIWEFEYEYRPKGKKRLVTERMHFRVVGWSETEGLFRLEARDGEFVVYETRFCPGWYEGLAKRVLWGGSQD
jgi:hypothetical protein